MKQIVLIGALVLAVTSAGDAGPIALSVSGGAVSTSYYARPLGPSASVVADIGLWRYLKSHVGVHLASIPLDVNNLIRTETRAVGGGRLTSINPHLGLTFRYPESPYVRAGFGFWYQHYEGIITRYLGDPPIKAPSRSETVPTFHLGGGFDIVKTRYGHVFLDFQYVVDLGQEEVTRAYVFGPGFRFR